MDLKALGELHLVKMNWENWLCILMLILMGVHVSVGLGPFVFVPPAILAMWGLYRESMHDV